MIYQKLLEIAKKKIVVNKDATNPFHKSKYATLDSIIENYIDVLNTNKIVVVHWVEVVEGKSYLNTKLVDSEKDNDFVETKLLLNEDSTMQKLWSSITYGKRYNLGCLLNITTDEDTDMWNWKDSKQEVKSDSKPRFNEKEFEAFLTSVLELKVKASTYEEALTIIKKKYNISKKMEDKVLQSYQTK